MHDKNSFNGKVIEGVDFETGIKRLGGKEDLYIRILKSYVSNMPDYIQRMRTFISSDDTINDYTIVVHGIKGSSYNIGADEIGKKAEELEMAAKSGDLVKIRAKNEDFIRDTEALVKKFDELIALNS